MLTSCYRFACTSSGGVGAVEPQWNVRSQRYFDGNLSQRSVDAGVGDDGKQFEKVSSPSSDVLVCVCYLCVFSIRLQPNFTVTVLIAIAVFTFNYNSISYRCKQRYGIKPTQLLKSRIQQNGLWFREITWPNTWEIGVPKRIMRPISGNH